MQTTPLVPLFILTLLLCSGIKGRAQTPENWTPNQLMDPSRLASDLGAKKELPVIISVGPGAGIPTSIDIGMVNNKEGLEKLKKEVKRLPTGAKIVVYCGCCPFEHCPNIRPAIAVLKELKFTNYYLLNLPHNLKKDWIDKGYPVSKS